jgi:hypothetical protein
MNPKLNAMKTKIFIFEENNITFTLDKDNKVMVNATEMAKVFDKYPKDFLILDSTKLFISECLKKEISPFLNIAKEVDLVVSRQKSGTFMHRVLALKFAAWLSPKFELWVYSTIDQLLFGKYVEREKSLEKTILLQKEMNSLVTKGAKTGEDFENYLRIEHKLRKEQQHRKNLTKESISEMLSLFNEKPDMI